MITKNDFSPEDWTTLRDTQYLAGFATLLAGSSGLATIKELVALTQAIIENQSSSIALIRDLTTKSEMEAAQTSLQQSFDGTQSAPSSDNVRRRALEQVRSAISILAAKGGKEESDAYRRLLYAVAEKVANAAREGGFLGFGGTQVVTASGRFWTSCGARFNWSRSKARNFAAPEIADQSKSPSATSASTQTRPIGRPRNRSARHYP